MPCLPLPRRVKLALRAHINHVQLLTPLVAAVARRRSARPVRRAQSRNFDAQEAITDNLLHMCFALQGEANILPYWFMSGMIPTPNTGRNVDLACDTALRSDASRSLLAGMVAPYLSRTLPPQERTEARIQFRSWADPSPLRGGRPQV